MPLSVMLKSQRTSQGFGLRLFQNTDAVCDVDSFLNDNFKALIFGFHCLGSYCTTARPLG